MTVRITLHVLPRKRHHSFFLKLDCKTSVTTNCSFLQHHSLSSTPSHLSQFFFLSARAFIAQHGAQYFKFWPI